MDNRLRLAVQTRVTPGTGTAERETAVEAGQQSRSVAGAEP